MGITKQPKPKEEQLTLEELADKIKGLISRSAKAKIEIGELLNKYTSDIEHGGKEAFYKSIDMSPTTAQYYMRIANNSEVQKLKTEDKLEGLNMSKILELAGMRVNVRGTNNENAPEKEYKPVPVDKFNWEKCRSTRVFKAQYEVAIDRIDELEKELGELQNRRA